MKDYCILSTLSDQVLSPIYSCDIYRVVPEGQLKHGVQMLCLGGELDFVFSVHCSVTILAVMLTLGLVFWIVEVEKQRRFESPNRTRKSVIYFNHIAFVLARTALDLAKNAVGVLVFKYHTGHILDCELQKVSTFEYIVYHIRKGQKIESN